MTTQAPVSPQLVDRVRQMMGGSWRDAAHMEEGMSVAKMIQYAGPPKGGPGLEAVDSIQKAFGIGGPSAPANTSLAQMMNQLTQQLNAAGIAVGKDIDFNTFTDAVPSTLGFNVFDLSGPANITAPFMAPIRGRIPRMQGRGPAGMNKVITGFSGSATGGIGSVNPAFPLQVPTAGSNLEAARGNPVSYALGDVIVPFKFFALTDSVTFPAFFAAEGFQDLRAMSAALLMQMAMMAEERQILMGRDAVLATPGQPTQGADRAVVAGVEVGILGTGSGGTNVYSKVTAVGPYGETAAGAASTAENIAQGTTAVVDITWTDVPYALAYNVYVALLDAGATTGQVYYLDAAGQNSSAFNGFTIGVRGRAFQTATAPASDTGTGSSDNYRGIIETVEQGPASGTAITGQSGRLNATVGTAPQITFLQNLFQTGWDLYKADYEEVLMNARERKNISNTILSGTSNSNYRVAFAPNEAGGIASGVIVSEVMNQSTGRSVRLTTHPWLPIGNAVGLTYSLPFATAFGDTTTMKIQGPQDYMQIMWSPTTLQWQSSIIWMNALMITAPTMMFVEHGIAQSTTAAAGAIS